MLELDRLIFKQEEHLATASCLYLLNIKKELIKLNKVIESSITDSMVEDIVKERYSFLKEHPLLLLFYKTILFGIKQNDSDIIAKAILGYACSVYNKFFLNFFSKCNEKRLTLAWGRVDKRSPYFTFQSHLDVVTFIVETYLKKYVITESSALTVLTLITNSLRGALRVLANKYYSFM